MFFGIASLNLSELNEHQEITCPTAVWSAACPGCHRRKHQCPAPLAFCEGKPPMDGGFPSQNASNTDSVSISCRHNEMGCPTSQWRNDTSCIAGTLWGESISYISGFPHKGPLMWSFGVYFVVSPNSFSNNSRVTPPDRDKWMVGWLMNKSHRP